MRATLILTMLCKGNDEGVSQGDAQLKQIAKTEEYIIYAKNQLKEEQYTIEKVSVGIHNDATRLHSHITFVLNIPEHKIVKHFNKKFEKILTMKDTEFDLKRSFRLDTTPGYDEYKALAYNMKEYENFEQVLMLPSFQGLTDPEIEEMRSFANNLWQTAKKEKDRNAKRNQFQDDERSNIFQYIEDFISPKNRQNNTKYGKFIEMTLTMQIVFTKTAVMQYYEDRYIDTGKSGFKAYSVKDIAINYLVCKNLVSKWDLAISGII